MILQFPDERLRAKAAAVTEFGPDLVELCQRLAAERMSCCAPEAVGLAAPQIGELVRVVSLNPGKIIGHSFMVNPEIVRHGAEIRWNEEGCMSIERGLRKFKVKRWQIITVRFQNLSGQVHEAVARGFPAYVVQHEVDHLSGRLVNCEAA